MEMQAEELDRCAEFVRRYWPDNAGLPKHERLRQAIKASIVDGFWQAGARLPAERAWVEATPCSLGTVQRALRELVADGLIKRRRGSGTVVADLGRPLDAPWHMRFLPPGGTAQAYLPVFTRVLRRRVLSRPGPWSGAIGQGDGKAVRIDRIMAVGDEFEVYAVFYAVVDRFPELVDLPVASLNGADLKGLIGQRHHAPVHRVRQLMRFEPVPAWVRSACRWPSKADVAVLNVVAYSFEGEAMYYQDFYVPPTDYVLDLGAPTGS